MNIELLRKVQADITTHPETFDMSEFNCGTAQCIAGRVAVLTGHKMDGRRDWTFEGRFIGDVAIDELGLTHEQGDALFYITGWPKPLAKAHALAVRANARPACARIACERIDAFIAEYAQVPYRQFCRHPDKCAGLSYCPHDPNCCD